MENKQAQSSEGFLNKIKFQENERMIPARSDDGNASEYDFRDKIEDAIIADKKIGEKYRAAFDLDGKLDIKGLDDLRVEMLQTLMEVVGNGKISVLKKEVVFIADVMLNRFNDGYAEKSNKVKQWEFAEKEDFIDPVRVMAMDTLGIDTAIEIFGTLDKPKEVSHELQEEIRSLSASLRLQGLGAIPDLQDIEKIKELAGLSEKTSARHADEFHSAEQNSVAVGQEERFLEAVRSYLEGGVAPTYNEFEILQTPKILQYAGIPNHKIYMTTKVLNKARDDSHNLGETEILSALKNLSNPVIVFDSDKERSEAKGSSVLIFTEAIDKNGKPFAIGFEMEIQKRGEKESHVVNQIRSVHSRTTLINSKGENMLEKWTEKGLMKYVDDKKISGWLKDRQVQFPLSLANHNEVIITDSSGNVKGFPVKTKSNFEMENGRIQNIGKERIIENQNVENITLALDAFKNGYQVPKHDGLDEYNEKTLVRNRGWEVNVSKADYETGEPLNVEIGYDGHLVADIDLKANEFKFAVTKSIYYGDEIREAALLAAKEVYPEIHYFGQEQPVITAEEADRMTISELKTEIQKNSDFELEIDGNEAHLKYVELDDEGNSVTRLDENSERVSRMYGLGSFHFENPQDFINKLERVSDNFDTWNCQKNYVSLLLEEEGSSAKKEIETAIAEFEKDGATKERIANATKAAQQDLDKQGLDYTVVKVMPKYTHLDDSHLFMCVAKRNSDEKYSAWSSLNVNGGRGSLENGHHDLETEEDACKVLLNFADESAWAKANPKILKLNENGAKVAETLRENLSEMVNDVCDFYYDPQNSLKRYLRKNPNEENRRQLTEEEFATVDRIIEATGSYWAILLTDKNENPFVYDRENEEIQEFKDAVKDLYDAAKPLFHDDEFAPEAYGLEEKDEKVLDGIMEKFGVVPTEKQIKKGLGKINSILGENFTSKDFSDFVIERNWNGSDGDLAQQQLQSFLAEKLTSAAYPNGLDANAIESDNDDVEIIKESIAKMSEKLLGGEYSFSKEQAVEKIKDVATRKPQEWLYNASIITDGISSNNIYQEPFDWLPVSNGFRELAGKLRNLERSLDYGEDFKDFANADFPKKSGEKYSEEELEKFKQITRSYRDMYTAEQYSEIMMEIAQIQTGEKYMLVDIHGETKDDIIAKLLVRESEYSEEFRKNVEIEFMNNGHSLPSQNATVEPYEETINDYLKNNFSDFELENKPGHFEIAVDAPDEKLTEEEIDKIEYSLAPEEELPNVFDNHYDERIDDRWDGIASEISNEISEKHGVEISPEAVAEYLKDDEILNIVYDGNEFLRKQSPETKMRLADVGISLEELGTTNEELARLNGNTFTFRDKELLEKVAKVLDVTPESLAADIADAESAAHEFYAGSYAEENGHSFKEYAASQLAVISIEREFSLEGRFGDAGIELEKIGLKIATGKIENHSQLAEEIEGVEKMLQEEKTVENETKLSAAEIAEKINSQEFYEYDVIDENDAEQFVKIAEHIGHEFKDSDSLYDDFKKSLNGKILKDLEEANKESPSVNATPFEQVAENVKKTLAKDGNDINAMSTKTIMTAFAKSIQTLSQKDKEAFSRQLIEMGGISKGSVEKLILKAAGKEIAKENRKLRDDYGIGR